MLSQQNNTSMVLCFWIPISSGTMLNEPKFAIKKRLSGAFDLLLIFLCSLIQTLTLTPPPQQCIVGKHGHVRLCY